MRYKVFGHSAHGLVLHSAICGSGGGAVNTDFTDLLHNSTIAGFMESSATPDVATFSSSVLVSGWKLRAKVRDGLKSTFKLS